MPRKTIGFVAKIDAAIVLKKQTNNVTTIGVKLNLHTPTAKQHEWRSRSERFIVLVTGRRCGKTIGMIELMAERAIAKPGQTLWYIAPTYDDAKDLAWDAFLEILPEEVRAKQPNQTSLTIWLKNKSKIRLVSAEKIQKRRGRGLDGVGIDEWTLLKSELWDEVISPSLADRQGWAIFAGTPTGKTSAAYKFWVECQGHTDFYCLSYTTAEGGLVPLEEIESQRSRLHPRKFRQEFEASWESPSGQILDAIDDRHKIPRSSLPDRFDTVVMGVDWGDINPCLTVIGVNKIKGLGHWYLLDAWHNPNAKDGIAVRDDELLVHAKMLWRQYKCSIAYADPSRPASIDFFNKAGLKTEKANNNWNEGASIVNGALYHDRLFIAEDLTQAWEELCGWHRATDRSGSPLDHEAPNQRAETPDCVRYTLLSYETKTTPDRRWWKIAI